MAKKDKLQTGNKMANSVLQVTHKLNHVISLSADSIAENKRLPEELVRDLIASGMFQLLLPKRMGGRQLDLPEYLSVIENIARADGSTAWCLNQNNVLTTFAGVMPKYLADEIWSKNNNILANGPPVSVHVVPAEGGYRLTGEWRLSSGFAHATWLLALIPGDNPLAEANIDINKQYMVIPKSQAEPVDDWHVGGLRGTGSNSFKVKNLFVPEDRAFIDKGKSSEKGSLQGISRELLFASGFASVALGISRASLDETIEITTQKTPQDQSLLRDQEFVQHQIGYAEALWKSAKSFAKESIADLLNNEKIGSRLPKDINIQVRLASTHAIRTSAMIVDIAYNLCGSHAVYESSPIHRRFQDIHAITQQIQGRMTHYVTAGKYFMGIEDEDGLL